MKFISKSLIIFLLLAACPKAAAAHNYHTSLTRIDFNGRENSLEIEINLFNHDLEKVLTNKNKKRIDIEKTKDIDRLLLEYLDETFVIKDASENAKKLEWVGKEISVDITTVFVQVTGVKEINGLKLQNKIFFESFSEQVNLVTIHAGDEKSDLFFKAGDGFKDFMAKVSK